jgi:hypothetical protein
MAETPSHRALVPPHAPAATPDDFDEEEGLAWAPVCRPAEPISDHLVSQVVHELNELHRGLALDAALKMGRLVVLRFYAGDLSSWRRQGTKELSFRRLAAHPDLRVSPTGLYRAVALYELTQRLGVPSFKNIGVTHLRLVLGLPDGTQRQLLADAERMRWSTEKLETEAARLRGMLAARRGRPAEKPVLKVIRRVLPLVRHLREMGGTAEYLQPLSPEEIRAAHQAATAAIDDLEQFQRRIRAREGEQGRPQDVRRIAPNSVGKPSG